MNKNKTIKEKLEAAIIALTTIAQDDCKHLSYEDSSDVVYRLQQAAIEALKKINELDNKRSPVTT